MTDISLQEYEKVRPTAIIQYENRKIKFLTPTQHTFWRCQSLFTKEPDTIDWIRRFTKNDVFIDVGANVGMYSIWAAATRGTSVYAFEPEASNYALLNQNIALNALQDQVLAFCVALSHQTKFDKLYLSQVSPGGSCHSFGEKVNFNLEPFKPAFAQGCFSTTLDDLIDSGVIPEPTKIKIDVDGLEHLVIQGAERILENPKLDSVLIETNRALTAHQALDEFMKNLGFKTNPQQMELALRTEGTFAGVGNIIYSR